MTSTNKHRCHRECKRLCQENKLLHDSCCIRSTMSKSQALLIHLQLNHSQASQIIFKDILSHQLNDNNSYHCLIISTSSAGNFLNNFQVKHQQISTYDFSSTTL